MNIRNLKTSDSEGMGIVYVETIANLLHRVKNMNPDDVRLTAKEKGIYNEFQNCKDSDGYVTKIAEIENMVVGWARLSIKTGEIDSLFVSPEFQKKGIGTRLLKSIEKAAIGSGLSEIHGTTPLYNYDYFSKLDCSVDNSVDQKNISFISKDSSYMIAAVQVKKIL